MAFDKNEFRKKAKAKAVRERVERIRKRLSESGDFPSDGTEGPKSASAGSHEDTDVEGHGKGGNKGQASQPVAEKKLSTEERKVLEQYRKWKKQRENVEDATPGADMEPEKDQHARNAEKGEVTNESRTKNADRTKAIREKIRKKLNESGGEIHSNGDFAEEGDDVEATAATPGKKGDADKVGSAPKKTLEAKKERVARIRRKLEKRARIEKIKERIAEKRAKDNDVNSSEKIREEASTLKKRIARVRKMLKEQDMGMAQPQQPAGDPQSQMMDPGMGMEQGMEQQLPPEIVAEIQNISSAAQNLASLAGIQPEPDMGADVEAGIPAETGAGVEGAEDQMVLESTEKDPKKKAKILESIRARKQMEDADNLVESTRDRVEKRRKALKELREKALNEDYKSEGAEETTAQVEKEVASYMGNDHNDPNQVVHQAGRKIDGPSPSMPGNKSLKPAKTWPTKPSKSQKFESEEVDENQEVLDEEDRSWDEKHIDHYIERKELSFKDMMQKGLLG